MSPSLASMFFRNAKRLGMISKEYAWILSQKTIDILQSTKFEVIESLQGALGFRSYVPASRTLHYFTQRWNRKFNRKVHVLAIWAYDTIWALADSIERVEVRQNSTLLLREILKSEFKGMSGDFQITERHLASNGFEIVNAVDHGERIVGYWTLSKGITRTHPSFNDVVRHSAIHKEDVIWPEGSTINPNGWTVPTSHGKKLRIGVQTGLNLLFVHAVYDHQKNVTNAIGFSVDVFNTCLQALPYEVTYEFVPYANGSYDEIIQKVYNKEIDGFLADTTIFSKRYKFVDFTATYTDLGLGTLVKTNRKDVWIFLRPMNIYKERQYHTFKDYADALTKGGRHGGADAIVDEIPYIKMFLGKYSNGDYEMFSSEPVTSGFGFIFAKGSPLVADMSREIAKIREDGTLNYLEKKWFNTEFPELPQDSSSKPKTMILERFAGSLRF
ncbi:hypothetical protein L1987_77739 [Smallanthus sonchifolius]|uniref:Uncharacterized protein n=1 Tax=Smallanthus sonchifolius TaxID=185202 RepID=A0ACB8ZAN9_9ASTR|nr:hypothetical protein L1987_77739 [Smallanthus sonchifolius]